MKTFLQLSKFQKNLFFLMLSLFSLLVFTSLFFTGLFSKEHSFSDPSRLMAPNFTSEQNPYLYSEFKLPQKQKEVLVANVHELHEALKKANNSQGKLNIILSKGVYTLDRTLNITADSISITTKEKNAEDVVIQGSGMFSQSGANNLIKVFAKSFVLDGITLQNSRWHLIQIAGEHNADYPIIRNCILRDSYQQLLKVSYDKEKKSGISSDVGLIENCHFYYSKGIGPNYYIGGIDAHAINNWVIRNNTFHSIASPTRKVAEHAIHIWNNSSNNAVLNNRIKNCDRGIGFGMGKRKKHSNIIYSNKGGVISGNYIFHENNEHPAADTGIVLEDSPLTIVKLNKIRLLHSYPNAIEYRFSTTEGVVIRDNMTIKNISSRDDASATLLNNTRY